jgi:hypothetical protein
MKTFIVQGKIVVRRNGAFYAYKKPMDLAERIHHRQGGGDAGWDRQMTKPAIKLRGSRDISNKSF